MWIRRLIGKLKVKVFRLTSLPARPKIQSQQVLTVAKPSNLILPCTSPCEERGSVNAHLRVSILRFGVSARIEPMPSFAVLSDTLSQSLKLTQLPVAVCFTNSIPPGVKHFSGTVPAGCRFWQEAVRRGSIHS